MPLSLVPADGSVLDAATALSRQFGLLTNDALDPGAYAKAGTPASRDKR
jgi:hypothetical protein